MANPVMKFQILASDPEGTARFYSDLFGWKVNADNPLGYRELTTGGAGIDGGIWPAPESAPNFVQLFVQVEDVAAMAGKAETMGARVIIPPTKLPQGEEMAVLQDPKGMSLGLWKK